MTKSISKFIKDLCFLEKSEGNEFVLSSGEKSRYYIDIKSANLRPAGNQILSEYLYNVSLEFGEIDTIGAVVLGGCALAIGLSIYVYQHTGKAYNVVNIRKVPKDHGSTKKTIEQPFLDSTNRRILIIEDVVTTGNSSIAAAYELEKENFNVAGILSVVDRRKEKLEMLDKYKFKALTTLEDIINAK